MLYSILAGLGIGLLGSFHCIGMCGPIALSLPIYAKSRMEQLMLIIMYNLGRATTYAALGALFGFIGNQFFLFGYQRTFSISLGIILLLFLFFNKISLIKVAAIDKLLTRLKLTLANLLQSSQNTFAYFSVGIVNGLLPCGLVYLAIVSAMATGSYWAGAILMFMFGLGTFPLMMALMIFGRFISVSFRSKMRRLIPVFIVFTALIIVLRGMNLGIPYFSPQLQETTQWQQVKCHK